MKWSSAEQTENNRDRITTMPLLDIRAINVKMHRETRLASHFRKRKTVIKQQKNYSKLHNTKEEQERTCSQGRRMTM
jgi:hypothetical protein